MKYKVITKYTDMPPKLRDLVALTIFCFASILGAISYKIGGGYAKEEIRSVLNPKIYGD